ncbi:hypothetical protein EZV61_01205 [Corallincola luteus]|uniref:Uncharacterized protein n=1 Tax=Corallincola luteus TaxID=1775177 RepID=A0ABY2ARB7_9GAMM|nr:hypothetical protein [Corallincola luteus]TCI04626.1 hypothetical protein EZV61_01205 [Corallincola luteus]
MGAINGQSKKAVLQRLSLGRLLFVFMLLWQGMQCIHNAEHPIHLQDSDAVCAVHFQQAQPGFAVAGIVVPELVADFGGYQGLVVVQIEQASRRTTIRGPPSYSA